MSDSILDFCERHNLTAMLNFLRHSGPATSPCMRDVFAVELLQQLLAGDGDKLQELDALKADIDPVERAAKHRASMKNLHQELARKKSTVIEQLREEIQELKRQLATKRLRTEEMRDTQLWNEGESQSTQPSLADTDYQKVLTSAGGH